MTLNQIMNLCRYICIAYITVRGYDTSFFKVTFYLLLLTSLNSSEMYVASGIVSLVKKSQLSFVTKRKLLARVSKVMQFLLLLNTYNTTMFISGYSFYLTMLYDTYNNDTKLDYESYLQIYLYCIHYVKSYDTSYFHLRSSLNSR